MSRLVKSAELSPPSLWLLQCCVTSLLGQPINSERLCCVIMSSATHDKGNHLDRTAKNTRENILSVASVIALRDESKTVKGVTLKIHERAMKFKSGQWVDMFIPGISITGGFSMCSSLEQLRKNETLDLAVKYSTHPPAKWMHEQCSIGDEVSVRVGGDFYFPMEPLLSHADLLLIAGGVGINPLISIIRHITDTNTDRGQGSRSDEDCPVRKCVLLYSASTDDELIFKDALTRICTDHDAISWHGFVTKESHKHWPGINYNRIREEDIERALQSLRMDEVLCFLCGPPSMIQMCEEHLIRINVPENHIFSEKWY